MNKFIRIALILTTVIALIGIAYLKLLYPSHIYKKASNISGPIEAKDLLIKSMPKKFSLEEKKIKTTIDLNEEDLKNLILSKIKQTGNVQNVDISIQNGKLNIFIYQKAFKLIPVEINLSFKSAIEDGRAVLVLDGAKLGEFKLNKEKLLNKIKQVNISFFDVHPLDGRIIFEDKDLKNFMTLTNLKLENQKASAAIEVEFNSLEDFLKLSNLLRKN